MKSSIYIALLFFVWSCGAQKKRNLIGYLKPRIEAKNLMDSLVNHGVDTVIVYSDRCSGCVSGVINTSFVYWVQNGENYLTKFTELSNYNTIRLNRFPIYFIGKNVIQINEDTVTEPDFGLMHHDYDEVEIKIGEDFVSFRINEFEKAQNPTNFKIITIDKIRSALFEIPDWEWNGLNFKMVK